MYLVVDMDIVFAMFVGIYRIFILFVELKPFVMLILFVVSTTFCLLATIITVLLLAFQRKRDFQCIGGILAATFSFAGGKSLKTMFFNFA